MNEESKPKIPSFKDIINEAQKIQQKMKWAQAELASQLATGQAGGVTVIINGRYEVKRITIEDGAWAQGKEMVADLVSAATNDALKQVAGFYQQQMGKLTAGMGIPKDSNLEQLKAMQEEQEKEQGE